MGGSVAGLFRYAKKGDQGQCLDHAMLISGKGMEEDMHCYTEKPLSILTLEARNWMEAQSFPGLCFARFRENILLRDVPTEILTEGDRLALGNTMLLICGHGKRCHPECSLFVQGESCRLTKEALFAAVEKGGIVSIGDAVNIVNGE